MYMNTLINIVVTYRQIARQQFPNRHQWTNWKAVFSTRFVPQLRDAKTEELLGEVISVLSVPRRYKQEKSRI
jgi:hypothetical protein